MVDQSKLLARVSKHGSEVIGAGRVILVAVAEFGTYSYLPLGGGGVLDLSLEA